MTDTDFDDFGLADDLDGVVPERLADNTYKCRIMKSTIITSKKDGKRYHVIDWMVVQDGIYYGEEISEMYRVAGRAEFEAADGDEQRDIKAARRKRIARIADLGFKTDNESLRSIKPEDLEDIEAFLTVSVRPKKDSNEFNVWVNKVVLATSVADTIADF